MKAFQYVTAQSAETAVDLAQNGGRFLAGGTDLLGQLKEYLTTAETVVNVKSLPNTREITDGSNSWTIGANVTITQIVENSNLRKIFPGLCQAAEEVGSLQIRNVATLAGNLAQHSRCWYYRHRDILCLKKGGSHCHSRDGENKYHAIFSGNPCISPVTSNLSIALSALDASIIVSREGKQVRLTMAEFYSKAWDNPLAHHSLAPADLILKVEIPVRLQKSAYLQVSEKSSFDWALVSCSAAATLDGETIKEGRVFLGAVAPIPYTNSRVSEFLKGKKLDEALATKAAELMLQDAKPFSQNGYKVPIAQALIRRALAKLKNP
jgi:xanthine dehydrogenase YagS FAD-binding subunit